MAQKQSVDLLVANGDLFTADKGRPHFRPGAIAVDDGTILAVGAEAEILSRFAAGRTIDAQGGIVHPGFIDTHLHATSMLLHGLPMDIAGRTENTVNYARIKIETDDDMTAAFTAAAAVVLLRRGYTLFMEAGTVFETDAFADALTRCGMRGLVSVPYGWDDMSLRRDQAPGTINDTLSVRAPADAKRVMDGLHKELRRNRNRNALVHGYVCLNGEGSASDDLIRGAVALARDHGVVFGQHQAFLPRWTRAQHEKYGESGVARLHRLGALGPATLLAHMNVLSADDADMIRATKTGVAWCPNNALDRGVFPAHRCYHPSFYKAGLNVSLAIDTTLTYPLGSAGIAALLLAAAAGEHLAAADPFHMQTSVAATNIGLGGTLGSLSAGKRADIVVRAVHDVAHTSLDEVGGVLGTSSAMIPVDTVAIDGRIVMQGGRLTTLDQGDILATAVHQRDRLLRRLAG